MLWAIARTVAQELPSTGVQAIDIQRQQQRLQGAPTATALVAASPGASPPALLPPASSLGSGAYGLAVQAGSLTAATLQRSAVKPMLPAFQLFPQPRGALQNLAALPLDVAAALAPGQVLVAVKAVGINFRFER